MSRTSKNHMGTQNRTAKAVQGGSGDSEVENKIENANTNP